MTSAVKDLLAILDLEPIEVKSIRGRSPQVGWQRVFAASHWPGRWLPAAQSTRIADRPRIRSMVILAGWRSQGPHYIRSSTAFGRPQLHHAARRGDPTRHAIFAMSVSFHGSEPD